MNWNYSLTQTEYLFIAVFVLLYGYFFFRIFRVARLLGTTAWATIPKFFLRTAYLTLLVVALLGPSFGVVEKELVSEGKDIYIAVDLSKSMDATDIPPTRLEKVKYELKRLIEALPGNRFGLLVFSTEAYVHAPLTSDQGALALFIQSLNTRLVPESGTNICSAIELALRKQLAETSDLNQTKVLVLLTDGEDFGECDPALAGQLRRYGIANFVVGVGTEAGTTISTPKGNLRDKDGNIVRSQLNRTYLRQFVKDTRGSYLELASSSGDLTTLVSAIQNLENRLVDQRKLEVTTNKYYYFLIAALVFIAVDILITVRTFRL
ncbi:vWA domain-containing protein [Larkinella terrae]|uniref:VWA domain-containing protein n=1 Tax=Larkinella terrae TaxID=2025311 RepID=A0A7K0EUC7_9BACT|nr:VWA domain-containing protein [Larkinella terrae]MRS65359.1 VWA domain-containing protein [Larkinella terrae]